jgi:hypothetical protein
LSERESHFPDDTLHCRAVKQELWDSGIQAHHLLHSIPLHYTLSPRHRRNDLA